MERAVVIYCTVPAVEDGSRIADDLVESGLAACVNMVPGVTSTYRWKGKICRDGELLLVIKTRKALFVDVSERIAALHPYEVPEIIAVDIDVGSEHYLRWIEESTVPHRG